MPKVMEKPPLSQQSQDLVAVLAGLGGMARLVDLMAHGFNQVTVRRLVAADVLVNPARGVYVLKEIADDPYLGIAVEAFRTPGSVVCLLSAAWIHRLTNRAPAEVWLAREAGAWAPVAKRPDDGHTLEVRTVRWADPFHAIETVPMIGRNIPVTTAAKTVADLFRYQRLLGLDCAMEALGAAIDGGVPIAEIEAAAEHLNILPEMTQYLQGAGALYNRQF